MILRLEHIEHMRPERLCRPHDERPGRVPHATRGERRRGAMYGDARLQQRIDKLRGGGKVGLVRRDDVAAGVAVLLSAGGKVTALDGGRVDLSVGQLIASNGRIHDALQTLVDASDA